MNRALVLVELVIALVCVVAVVIGFRQSEDAVSRSVKVAGGGFSPTSLTISQGTKVVWKFGETQSYTVTSPAGFFNSGLLGQNASYPLTFSDAGSFGYRSVRHATSYGVVKVLLRAGGSATAGWKITWSDRTKTPATRLYDVQLRGPGGTGWRAYRTDTKTRTGRFDPSVRGTYEFRARTDNITRRTTSGWSPELSVRIP